MLFYNQNGIKQYITQEGSNWILTNVIDENPTKGAFYEERKDNETNGYNKSKTMRKLGGIPNYRFRQEPLLREYMMAKHDDPQYASRCIRLWMKLENFNSVDRVVV